MEWYVLLILLSATFIVGWWICSLINEHDCRGCRQKKQEIARLTAMCVKLIDDKAQLDDTELKLYAIKKTLDRLYGESDNTAQEFTPPEG